jgi:hypothetical protein
MRIWIDLANTPHVLFFEPVIRELQRRGHAITLTARRFASTLPLAMAGRATGSRSGAGTRMCTAFRSSGARVVGRRPVSGVTLAQVVEGICDTGQRG